MSQAPSKIDPAGKASIDMQTDDAVQAHESLDPKDWPGFRTQAHLMLDEMLGYIETIRERPVWQPIPAEVRAHFRSPAPRAGEDLAVVHAELCSRCCPMRRAMCIRASWAG